LYSIIAIKPPTTVRRCKFDTFTLHHITGRVNLNK